MAAPARMARCCATAPARSACRTPRPTMASKTSVPTRANGVVRELGTASEFQMPPRPARLPIVPSQGSAREAKAPTALGSERTVPPIDATIHGTFATRPSSPARARLRPRSHQGHQGADQRDYSAGRSQRRDSQAQRETRPRPRIAGIEPNVIGEMHGPEQTGVSDEQAPMSLHQAFGDVGIPDRDRDCHHPGAGPHTRQHRTDQGVSTQPGQQQSAEDGDFDDDPAVDHDRQHCDECVLRDRPGCRIGRTQGRVRQIRPRRAHEIAMQQISRCERRPTDDRGEKEAIGLWQAFLKPQGGRRDALAQAQHRRRNLIESLVVKYGR